MLFRNSIYCIFAAEVLSMSSSLSLVDRAVIVDTIVSLTYEDLIKNCLLCTVGIGEDY